MSNTGSSLARRLFISIQWHRNQWLAWFYRIRNRKKLRILIYSDSRGLNLVGRFGKTEQHTYVTILRQKFHCTYVLSPYSHTTIIDFLNDCSSTAADFDAVLLHCGVVDFSPRPLSNLESVQNEKRSSAIFKMVFDANQEYYSKPWPATFRGEETINLYSKDYLVSEIMPKLHGIPNLIWISSNDFVQGWDGNYLGGRPPNIQSVVRSYDETISNGLDHVIDLHAWRLENVRRLTIDNIHFTPQGFELVADLAELAIKSICTHGTSSS